MHGHDGPGVDVAVAVELDMGIGLVDHAALLRPQTGRRQPGLALRRDFHVVGTITAYLDRDLMVVDEQFGGARHAFQHLPGMDLLIALRVLRFQEDQRGLVSHLFRYHVEADLHCSSSDLTRYITSGDRLQTPQSGLCSRGLLLVKTTTKVTPKNSTIVEIMI